MVHCHHENGIDADKLLCLLHSAVCRCTWLRWPFHRLHWYPCNRNHSIQKILDHQAQALESSSGNLFTYEWAWLIDIGRKCFQRRKSPSHSSRNSSYRRKDWVRLRLWTSVNSGFWHHFRSLRPNCKLTGGAFLVCWDQPYTSSTKHTPTHTRSRDVNYMYM